MNEGIAVAAREFSPPDQGWRPRWRWWPMTSSLHRHRRLERATRYRSDNADDLATLCAAVGLSRDDRPDTPTGISGHVLPQGAARRLVLLRVGLSPPAVPAGRIDR